MAIEPKDQKDDGKNLMPFPRQFAKQISAISSDDSPQGPPPPFGTSKQFVTASGIVFSSRSRSEGLQGENL